MKKSLSVLVLVLCGVHGGATLAGDENTQQAPAVDKAEVDQALSDLNDRLTQARAVPHFENSKPAGYKVVEPQAGSVYEKLELRNGDVIQEVNGQKVNDPQHAFEMMNTLKKANQLKVVRDGTEHMVEQGANSDPQNDQAQ